MCETSCNPSPNKMNFYCPISIMWGLPCQHLQSIKALVQARFNTAFFCCYASCPECLGVTAEYFECLMLWKKDLDLRQYGQNLHCISRQAAVCGEDRCVHWEWEEQQYSEIKPADGYSSKERSRQSKPIQQNSTVMRLEQNTYATKIS